MEIITHKSEAPRVDRPDLAPKFALICSNVGVMRCPFDAKGNVLDGVWLNEAALADSLSTLLKTTSIIANSDDNKIITPKENCERQFVSERILFENSDAVVWYSPANRKVSQYYTERKKPLSPVPHPQLVFFVSKSKQRLSVIATNELHRPSLQSGVYHAPLANMYQDTHLCLGSATLPKERSSRNISEIENCLLGSRYSGFKFNSLDQGDTKQSSVIDVWADLQSKDTFPVEMLKTVCDVSNIEEWVTQQMVATGGSW